MTEALPLTRTAVVAGNALASYLRCAVSLAVVIALTPQIIHHLGPHRYGLWMLLASLIGYLDLLDCGLATTTVRFVGRMQGANDVAGRNRLLSTLLATHLGLSLLVVVAAAAWLYQLPQWLADEPPPLVDEATAAFAILAAKAALSMPLGLFQGVLFGQQRIALVSWIRAGAAVAQGIAAWRVLAAGQGLVGLAAVSAATAMAEQAVMLAACWRHTPDLRIHWRLFDPRLLRRLLGFSLFALLANLSTAALLRTDPLLVRLFLPLAAVGVYALALKIAEQLLTLTKQGINAFTPLLAALDGAARDASIGRVLIHSTRASLTVLLALGAPLACWSSEFIGLWIGPGFQAATPVLRLLLAAVAFRVVQECGANVLAMTGRHRMVAAAAALNAVLNVALSLLLLPRFGLQGVACGTLLSTALTALILAPAACAHRGVSLSVFATEGILPVARAAAAAAAAHGLMRLAATPQSWLELAAAQAGPTIALGLSIWKFTLTAEERAAVARWLSRMAARVRAFRPHPTALRGD